MLALVPALVACVDDGQGPVPEPPPTPALTLENALVEVADNAILRAVDNFRENAEGMESAARDFIDSLDTVGATQTAETPQEEALEALQQQWRNTFESWYRLSLYNFGPLNDNFIFPAFTFIDALRLRGTNYLETVRSDIANDVAQTNTLDDDYFSGKNFNRVGLLALESLIFETSTAEHSTELAAIVSDYQQQPRKGEILLGQARQLVGQARYVQDGWLIAYQGSGEPFRSLFLRGELDDDGTEPFPQVFIAGQEFLEHLQARRVVVVAAQVSGHAWPAIGATIDEVELLLRGSRGSADNIFGFMESVGRQNEVDDVEDSIRQIRQAIAERNPDMLEVTLGFLDGNFKREIPDSLDVDLGINFSDGD